MATGECATCSRPFQRATTGRRRHYCSDACRAITYRGRHRPVSLGDELLREAGIEPVSALKLLLAQGVRGPFA